MQVEVEIAADMGQVRFGLGLERASRPDPQARHPDWTPFDGLGPGFDAGFHHRGRWMKIQRWLLRGRAANLQHHCWLLACFFRLGCCSSAEFLYEETWLLDQRCEMFMVHKQAVLAIWHIVLKGMSQGTF